MSDTFGELDAIVWHQYETGEHGGCRLCVAPGWIVRQGLVGVIAASGA